MNLTLSDFFFNTPIYTDITVKPENKEFLREILGKRNIDFDGFNPNIKRESTFKVTSTVLKYNEIYLEQGGYTNIEIQCKRSDDNFQYYILWIPEENRLLKVGQYPSVADFHIQEIKQYSKLLPDDKLREFTRAIGLAANGVGIGSYVYLRRIFEYLIQEAFLLAKSTGEQSTYQKSRMDEKIELLREFLPTFLVENKAMYSILSLGVHELDEKTCLAHFDTLRVGIEIILDEKLDEFRKRKKIDEARKKLNELRNNVKK